VTTPHATIIGAGIVGISTAAFLQRQGFSVTVIDRVPPGEGCSFGNAGGLAFAEVMPTVHPRILLKIPGWLLDPLGPLTIRWAYLPKALPWLLAVGRNAMPDRVRLITEARFFLGLRVVADFETLLKAAGCHDLMVYADTLRLYDTEAQYAAEAHERAVKESHGYTVKRLTGDEAREIEPAVSPHIACGSFHGGWYFVRNPGRLVKSLAAQVVNDGGALVADEVRRIVMRDGKAITLELGSGKTHALDRLAICAGAYSHLLAGQVGDRVLLEAERGYHMVLPNPGISLSRSITYARVPAAATPMEMGLRLAGTDELAGLDAPPDYRRADALWTHFKHALPGLNPPDATTTRWMGRRPGTPDSLPVIGPSARASNVWYGFGHSHMGLAWGPTTGRLISEQMAGAPANADLMAFRVDRF
jgi:D-amino-acid dehydrogenase